MTVHIRRSWQAVGGLAVALTLCVGCVPHPPKPAIPVALSVAEDGLQMTVCFGPAKLTRLVVSVREEADDVVTDWSRVLETSDDVRLLLEFGDVVPLQREIPSVTYMTEPSYSLPATLSSVGVTITLDYESDYYQASFPSRVLPTMSSADYLYSDGTVHAEPCEMNSAQKYRQ